MFGIVCNFHHGDGVESQGDSAFGVGVVGFDINGNGAQIHAIHPFHKWRFPLAAAKNHLVANLAARREFALSARKNEDLFGATNVQESGDDKNE